MMGISSKFELAVIAGFELSEALREMTTTMKQGESLPGTALSTMNEKVSSMFDKQTIKSLISRSSMSLNPPLVDSACLSALISELLCRPLESAFAELTKALEPKLPAAPKELQEAISGISLVATHLRNTADSIQNIQDAASEVCRFIRVDLLASRNNLRTSIKEQSSLPIVDHSKVSPFLFKVNESIGSVVVKLTALSRHISLADAFTSRFDFKALGVEGLTLGSADKSLWQLADDSKKALSFLGADVVDTAVQELSNMAASVVESIKSMAPLNGEFDFDFGALGTAGGIIGDIVSHRKPI